MKLQALAGACLLVLAGCASQPGKDSAPAPAAAPAAVAPQPEPEPASGEALQAEVAAEPAGPVEELDGDLLYNLLVGELAGRSGRLDLSLDYYMEAMRTSEDPRVAERATRIAVYARDNDAASRAAQRWSELAPESSEPRQVMAGLYLRVGDVDSAFAQLQAMINNEPAGRAEGLSLAAALINREQNVNASLRVVRRLSEAFPEEPGAWYLLSQIAIRGSERDEAMAALDKAIELNPDYSDALLLRGRIVFSMGQTEKAFEMLQDAVQRLPEDAELRMGYARLLVQARQYERASRQFEELYQRNPDSHDLLYSLGLLAIESQRYEDATRYLERLLELGARTSEANYYLGRVAEAQRRFQDAIRHYLKVNDNETRLDAQVRTAVILGRLGRTDEARQHLARLRSQYPEPQDQLRFVRAEAEVLREARQYQAAYNVLTQGLSQAPTDTDMLYMRALIAERLDRLDLFEADLRQVLAIEPDNGHAYNALGYYLADRTDRLAEAEAYLQRAIGLLPDDPAVIDSMGWLRYRQGRHEEALEWLRRALAKMHDPEIAAHLGEVLWVMGDQAAANDVWNKALEASPDDKLLNDVIRRFRR